MFSSRSNPASRDQGRCPIGFNVSQTDAQGRCPWNPAGLCPAPIKGRGPLKSHFRIKALALGIALGFRRARPLVGSPRVKPLDKRVSAQVNAYAAEPWRRNRCSTQPARLIVRRLVAAPNDRAARTAPAKVREAAHRGISSLTAIAARYFRNDNALEHRLLPVGSRLKSKHCL